MDKLQFLLKFVVIMIALSTVNVFIYNTIGFENTVLCLITIIETALVISINEK